MADLLTDAQREDIFGAIRDVTDTFFKTPVIYQLYLANLDPLNVGTQRKNYIECGLKALVEYEQDDSDKVEVSTSGKLNKANVKVSVNYRDLWKTPIITGGSMNLTTQVHSEGDAQNFTSASNFVIMKADRDFMVINGQRYEVEFVGLDGPLTAEAALVIIKGRLEESKS